MSEMVERVARAIWESECRQGLPNMEHYRLVARAAIEALREPTYDMRFANDVNEWPEDAAACWKAMIDAALTSEQDK